jgi:Ca2+-binding RTX toxin-like protein
MRRTIVLLATMALAMLVISGVDLAVTKIGGPAPNTSRGTNGADDLLGNGANDVLYALGGMDYLLGGEGKDWLLGGNQSRPFEGDKNLVGGAGNDGVQGGLGSDTLLGGEGDDFVHGDNGSDRALVGEEGRDFIDGARSSDRMMGQGGGDLFFDGPFDEDWKDLLSGGEGDDIIVADHVPAAKKTCSQTTARRCGSSTVLRQRLKTKNKRSSSPSLLQCLSSGVPSSRDWHQARLGD